VNEVEFRHLIAAHARFPGALLAVFHEADEALLRSRESEGRWSPLEILAHLRDEEIEDFRPRAMAIIEGRPIEKPIDPQRWVVERRYNEMDPGGVFLDWAAERADSCRWLETLTPSDLGKFVDLPKLGRMRAGDFIASWRVHDLLHLRQFATAIAILTVRRYAGWRTDYAGKIPGA
jgi:hypothetical protein